MVMQIVLYLKVTPQCRQHCGTKGQWIHFHEHSQQYTTI